MIVRIPREIESIWRAEAGPSEPFVAWLRQRLGAVKEPKARERGPDKYGLSLLEVGESRVFPWSSFTQDGKRSQVERINTARARAEQRTGGHYFLTHSNQGVHIKRIG